MRQRTKVVLAKTSLDGHDRGVKVLSHLLRDAGMEVVYLGMHQQAKGVARTCAEEDADVLGLSFLSGEHLTHTPEMVDALKDVGIFGEILFLVGGILPYQDIEEVKRLGVDEVFLGGTPVDEIVDYITSATEERRTMRTG